MITNEEESIVYWNKRFAEHNNHVGWGSTPGSSWYTTKQKYITELLYKGEINQILYIGCGNAFMVMEVKNPFNTIGYTGIDACENQIKFNVENFGKIENVKFEQVSLSNLLPILKNMKQGNPSIFHQSLFLLLDVLFHIPEDELYWSTLQTILDCKPLYFSFIIAESNETEAKEEENHFITRPFMRDLPGYTLIKEEASVQLSTQKLLIYRRI